jgi:hypothetical protein
MRLRALIDILRARVEDNHFGIPLFQTLRFNGGPVVFSWKKEQSDAARNHKDRTVIKHCNVTGVVHNKPATMLATNSRNPTTALYQPTALARKSSGTKSEASALPTDRNVP